MLRAARFGDVAVPRPWQGRGSLTIQEQPHWVFDIDVSILQHLGLRH